MKFSCEKALLQSAVSATSRIVSSKSAIPALEGILIEVGDTIRLTGYNLETGVRTEMGADIEKQGKIVLAARLFSDIVRRLPDDVATIELGQDNMVSIRCGQSSFDILGTPASDFPEIPEIEGNKTLKIPQGTLKSMISQTIFAVSENENKPIHTGSLFEIEEKRLTVVSVDGFRLSLRREEIDVEQEEKFSFVVPGNALKEIERILSTSDEEYVEITLGGRHILFSCGETTVFSRLLEGEFINYRNATPATNKIKLKLGRRSLIESVERVSLLISEKQKNPVRFQLGQDIMKLSCVTAIGKASDECPVEGFGEDIEVGFNNRYVIDALKAIEEDETVMEINSNLSPCLFMPVEGDKYMHMVLPVRLRAE